MITQYLLQGEPSFIFPNYPANISCQVNKKTLRDIPKNLKIPYKKSKVKTQSKNGNEVMIMLLGYEQSSAMQTQLAIL